MHDDPKCPGCGTRGGPPHEVDDAACREMQYERAWKNQEVHYADDDDMDVLA